MIIKSINIISFGKLKNKQISFSDKLNVIYGRNESGKTTISAFIEAMLYSFPPRSDRAKYLPWDNSTAAGEMSINLGDKDITFYRKFAPQPKGDVLEPKDFSLKGVIPPDRDSYRKSVYASEGCMGSFGTTDHLDTIISNLLATGDESIGAKSAIKNLEKLRRSLNAGGKLKEYENKISMLENEYSAAVASCRQSEALQSAIEEKSRLIKEYEAKAKKSESGADNAFSAAIAALDYEIKTQEDYIKTFPSEDIPLPSKPPFVSKSFIIHILCTALVLVAGFFTHWTISLLSPIPLIVYFALYLVKRSKYKSFLQSFLHSAGCSDIDEYTKLLADKAAAEDYYTALLKKKSDLVTASATTAATESDLLYKKILDLKYELEALEKTAQSPSRELSSIVSELDYYRGLRRELSDKLDAVRLAIDGINHAKDIIATDFTPTVTSIAMSYLNRIAPKDGRYATLCKDMTLTISDGAHQPIMSHSFGFREEMYLCFRIAWSEFLFGKNFPLIIDDPFLGSDDYREKALIDLLYSLSEDRQIIIFTNRKNSYFNQLNCNCVDIST